MLRLALPSLFAILPVRADTTDPPEERARPEFGSELDVGSRRNAVRRLSGGAAVSASSWIAGKDATLRWNGAVNRTGLQPDELAPAGLSFSYTRSWGDFDFEPQATLAFGTPRGRARSLLALHPHGGIVPGPGGAPTGRDDGPVQSEYRAMALEGRLSRSLGSFELFAIPGCQFARSQRTLFNGGVGYSSTLAAGLSLGLSATYGTREDPVGRFRPISPAAPVNRALFELSLTYHATRDFYLRPHVSLGHPVDAAAKSAARTTANRPLLGLAFGTSF